MAEKKFLKIKSLALALFFAIVLSLPASSYAFSLFDNWWQTEKPCTNDWTGIMGVADFGSNLYETICYFNINSGSTHIILKWNLTNRGGIPNPLCFVTCTDAHDASCTGGNWNDKGILKSGFPDKWNLGLVEQVAVVRPKADNRYQVVCCEKEMGTPGTLPHCKDNSQTIRSKKFTIDSSPGWGSCPGKPETIYLTQPTTIGRAIVSITTGVKQVLMIGIDPGGCASKIVETACSQTLVKLGPVGEVLSSVLVSNTADLSARVVANNLSAGQSFYLRTSCQLVTGGVKLIETYLLGTRPK